MTRRSHRGLLALAVTAAALAGGAGPVAAQDAGEPRVLVISAPRLTWQDVVDDAPPALNELFARSAVASLSVRAIGPRTDLGEAYVSIGAGNRARIDRAVAGDAVGVDEVLDGRSGADLYELVTGQRPDGDVVHLAAEAAADDADALLYGAEPGATGTALRGAGHQTAVVANADGNDGVLHREAVLALMDGAGVVDAGQVDLSLTREAPDEPTGRVTDRDAALRAFDAAWVDGAAVLVELSDLERVQRVVAEAAAAGLPAPDRRAMTSAALARSDELVAGLLERVDPARDLVMVVAPTSPGGRGQLTVFAIAGPGIEPGKARSATTRRDGYVTLPDVGVTILEYLGVDVPDAMNATAITSGGGRPYDEAVARSLAADDTVARFRDRTVGPMSVAYIVTQVIAYGLGAVALSTRRRGVSIAAEVLALTTLSVPLVAFASGAVRVEDLGVTGYVVAVLALALALGTLARLSLRRAHRLAPVVAIVAANWALQVADILAGGRLQLDTPFGYSPIVAGRFQGFGNLAFALLVSTAIIVAASPPALATARLPDAEATGRTVRGAPLVFAIAVLGLTLLVDGLPAFGSDVGGVLASVPAYVTVLALLARWRISWRLGVAVAVTTVAAIVTFALVDLARPEGERTHLGRFVERVMDGEADLIVRRKLNANWSILTSSVWTWLVPFGLAFLAFLSVRRTGFLRRLQDGVPGVRAALAGCLMSGFLGFALNDSGVAVPAMMFGVVLPWITVGVLASEGPRGVRTLVGLLAGALAGALLWRALLPTLSEPIFERENYRGHRLPVAAGLVVVLAGVLVAGVWIVVLAGWDDERAAVGAILWSTATAATGFGLLGLLDDLAGSGASRGFRGHLRALAAGRLSTGMVKLAGGAIVALVAVASLGAADSVGELIVRGAVVALAANLANLFDRAPGRVVKVTLLAFAVVVVAVRLDVALCGPAIVAGAGAAMLLPDLRERCMLGDTGANVLGAAVGLAIAASVATGTAIVVAVGLAALNVASEWVSFSRVIDRVAVLRWADRLGAPHRAG